MLLFDALSSRSTLFWVTWCNKMDFVSTAEPHTIVFPALRLVHSLRFVACDFFQIHYMRFLSDSLMNHCLELSTIAQNILSYRLHPVNQPSEVKQISKLLLTYSPSILYVLIYRGPKYHTECFNKMYPI